MVRWVRWHCHPDTGCEIQTLEILARKRYLSVTEAPHSTEFYECMWKKHFCFFQTTDPGKRTRTLAWKADVLTTTPGPPPGMWNIYHLKASTTQWPSVGLMLGQRRRRWANIKPTLGQQCVFAELRPVRTVCDNRQTDRQIFYWQKTVITDLYGIEMKEIYVHVYTRLLIC